MRWLLLFGLCVPSLARARTAAESEAFMRDRIAPKIDLMCGTHLDVRYDIASLATANVENTCEEPLRFFYYACQKSEARHAIQLAHLHRYQCRGVGRGHMQITVEHGTLTIDVDPHEGISDPLDELANRLNTGVSPFDLGMDGKIMWNRRDEKWEAFLAVPVPVPTSTDFCVVDGKKIPLPPTGDPLAPPHVSVRCVHGGKVVTEMSADGTGFVTRLDGSTTRFDSYKLGQPDGESWVRAKGIVSKRFFFVDGREAWRSVYFPDGKLNEHSNATGLTGGVIHLDDHERITQIDCGDGAPNDPVLRGPCGYDAPRKLTIYEPGNVRTVIMTNGKARLAQ